MPRGRREQRKVLTRSELLQAGRELFSERGLYESRIEDLTARAGIAKGTLYRYFSDKDALVLAVVNAGFDALDERIMAKTSRARTHAAVVAGIVEGHVEFFADNPDLLRLFHQVRGLLKFNQQRWRPLRAVLSRHIERMADLLARPLARADRRPPQRVLAMLLFGSISGFCSVRAALDPDASLAGAGAALAPGFVALSRARAKRRDSSAQRRTRPASARRP